MGDVNLDEIEARCEAATPGPWTLPTKWRSQEPHLFQVQATEGIYHDRALGEMGPGETRILLTLNGNFEPKGDAAFIANAREDVPALLSIVRDAVALRRLWRDKGTHDDAYGAASEAFWKRIEALGHE